MESIARPLRRLQEEAAWFTRATELKLLHVRTDVTLRGGALDLLMAYEHHADNRALFFRFDDPMTGIDRGWAVRMQRLREQWAAKIESVGPAGIHLKPLASVVAVKGQAGGEFAAALLAARQSLAAPLTGLVVVLAPTRVEDAAEFAQVAAALVGSPQLEHVRWIVVEVDGAAVLPVARRLPERALACDCLVDEKEQQDDLAALGAAKIDQPPPRLPVAVGWRAPGAMPDVVPPPRIDLPRPPTDAELRAQGLSPAFINGGGEALKQLILGAGLALRQGRPVDAVTLQGRAAALCAEMEMPREQVMNLHVLGGYVMAAGQRARAREVYRGAGEIARAHAAVDLEAKTELALGLLDAVDQRPAEAATHYSAAARLAERAKLDALAIECWRMAGQLALDAKLETSAVDCWKRAVTLADPLAPEVAKVTSASEAALALAALCRKRGLYAQAQSLEDRAGELEAGLPPEPAQAALP